MGSSRGKFRRQKQRRSDRMKRTNSRGSGPAPSVPWWKLRRATWAPLIYRQDGRVWHPRWAWVGALVHTYRRLQETLGDWASPVLSAAGCLLLTAVIILGVALWVR